MAVQREPLSHVLWREDVVIESVVVAGSGIQVGSSVFGDEAVELVRNGIVAGFDAQLIDFFLDFLAFQVVGGLCEQFILCGDGVEVDFLGGVVGRSDAVGSLEHDVLEVVGYARVGTVHGPSLDDDGPVDLRLRVVFVEPDGHSVAEPDFADAENLFLLCRHGG